ncbi:MAG: dockerin type I repeat-containing protein [Ruminococcus sp.]|nr:dockerin type I repeat-containing protein [Ruminococcus sp.]
MKKILCFTIALIMLLGVVSVSAVTEEGNLYSNEFYQPRFQKWYNQYVEKYPPVFDEEYWYERYVEYYRHYGESSTCDEGSLNETTPDYIVVEPFPVGAGKPREYIGFLGDFVLWDVEITYPFPTNLYVYISTNDEVVTLREAYEILGENLNAGLTALTQMDKPRVGRSGDADFNGKLDIKDATLLQKKLAGLETMYECEGKDRLEYNLYRPVLDFDRDGKINIIDVTSIQKCLAGLPFFVDDGNYYLW